MLNKIVTAKQIKLSNPWENFLIQKYRKYLKRLRAFFIRKSKIPYILNLFYEISLKSKPEQFVFFDINTWCAHWDLYLIEIGLKSTDSLRNDISIGAVCDYLQPPASDKRLETSFQLVISQMDSTYFARKFLYCK